MLCFALLSLLTLLFVCALIYRGSKFPRHLCLDGFNLSLIFFGFYFILRPFDYLVIGKFLRVKPLYLGTGIDVDDYLAKSLACSVVAFACFLFGYFSNMYKPFLKRVNKAINALTYGIRRNALAFSISLVSLSLCIALCLGSRLFTNTFLLLTGLSFIAVKSKKHKLMWFIVFLIIVVYGFYHYLFVHAERRDLFKLLYVVVMLSAAFASVAGVRIRNAPVKKAFTYFLLLIGFVYLAFLCRFYSVFHNEKNLKQILSLDHLYTSNNPHDAIALNLDFALVYDDYMFLLNTVPDRSSYIYGKTYSKFLFGFIPRSFWPEKPETVNVLYFKTFFPQQYRTGLSRATSMIGELYWNFSYLGIVCGMYIMGVSIRILDAILYFSIIHGDYVKIMFICLLLSYVLDIYRGGLFTNFAQIFMAIFLLPCTITILTIAVRKNAKLNNKT